MKRQPTKSEKYLQITSDKRLISEMYKYLTNSIVKTKQ